MRDVCQRIRPIASAGGCAARILAACLVCQLVGRVIAAPPSDAAIRSPMELLLGVENARTAHPSVVARMHVSISGSNFEARSYNCLVEQEGTNRRFEVDNVSGLAQVIIYRGDESYCYRRSPHGDVRLSDVEYGMENGDIAYDPRLLGLSETLTCTLRVEECLWYGKAASLVCEGPEEIEGVMAWKVIATRDNGTSSTHWIEEPSFRVRKRVIESPHSVTTIISSYDGVPEGSPFPSRVETRYESASGETRETVTEIEQFDLDAKVPGDRFTLASMDLPLNTGIVDYRISKVVGFWDGAGVSPERVRPGGGRPGTIPDELVEAKSQNRLAWVIAVNVLVVPATAGFWYWRRRSAA